MEIIIGLLVVAGVAWFFFMRNDKKSDELAPAEPNNITAPYKVPEPAATTPIPLVVETAPVTEEVAEEAPVVEEVVESTPVVEEVAETPVAEATEEAPAADAAEKAPEEPAAE